MKDVSGRVFELQEAAYALFRRDAAGIVEADPDRLIPGGGIDAAGWKVLDSGKPDGLDLRLVGYSAIKLDKNREVGDLVAVERPNAATRLFLVWVPSSVVADLRVRPAPDRLHFHILYHPPTWESCYVRTPYWDGVCPSWAPIRNEERDVCVPDMDQKPLYVRLGLRYLSRYSLAVPQHLVAQAGRKPRMIYVTPVADSRDFPDLVSPVGILSALREIADFLVSRHTKGAVTSFPGVVGNVVLSGYSRSGTHLAAVMARLSPGDAFFSKNLTQVIAFDINLGDNQQQREAVFNPLWDSLFRWKSSINRKARVSLYTAYRYHADYMLRNSRGTMEARTSVDLDKVGWTDEGLRKARGSPRGEGIEAYDSDASLALVHLPPTFPSVYLGAVANPRGYVPKPAGNGHSWYLKALMSHALAHGDPATFGPPR
jgi:hypothetical protein